MQTKQKLKTSFVDLKLKKNTFTFKKKFFLSKQHIIYDTIEKSKTFDVLQINSIF